MSASAWDRAVDLAARAVVLAQSNGCCDQWPKPCADCDCFRDQRPDVMAGYERAHAHAALAAALPVLLEELAQRIEGGADGLVRTARQAVEDGDKGLAWYASIKAEGVRCALGAAAHSTELVLDFGEATG